MFKTICHTGVTGSIIARHSRLRKPADIGAAANAYRLIRCKIINLTSGRLIILHQTKLSALKQEDNTNKRLSIVNRLNDIHEDLLLEPKEDSLLPTNTSAAR